jgi:apolipoprotein N-acyltransferase
VAFLVLVVALGFIFPCGFASPYWWWCWLDE